MEIKGKLLQLLPVQTGEGKNGTWKKQDIVVEQMGQIPKKVCVSVWGDKINVSQYHIGAQLTLQVDVESREFNGKWYTDVKAWKIEGDNTTSYSNASIDSEEIISAPTTSEDDLPF